MLDVKDAVSVPNAHGGDYVDPITADPREFAAKVNAWVPHDIVLKDAWFPLAHSFAVTKKPVRRAIYSQPYFLWREGETAVAAEFHPAEVLSGTKSTYSDATGRYPVIEKYGYVWCWFGNPANAAPEHIPSLPYLPEDGGLPMHMLGTVRFDCTAPLSLENLIDLTHADFLHADVVGDEKMDKETVEVFHDSESITMVRTCVNKSVAPSWESRRTTRRISRRVTRTTRYEMTRIIRMRKGLDRSSATCDARALPVMSCTVEHNHACAPVGPQALTSSTSSAPAAARGIMTSSGEDDLATHALTHNLG